jgi:hypothetical protein
MVRRVLVGISAALLMALVMASCSSTESGPGGISSGGQGGEQDQDASGSEEATAPPADGANDAEATAALCPEGSWGNVPDTQCHLIAQDCPLGQTSQPNTKCVSANNGMKTRGEPCAVAKDCASGLRCVLGYCSPFCCKEAEFEICGPGGQCMVNNTVSGSYYVMMCSYLKPCTLWKQECPAGEGCHVVATDGSGACVPPPGSTFLPEGAECQYANDCGDNQICITPNGTAISTCRYLCNRGGGPIDTGDAGPGLGACPDGQTCLGITDYPKWLGVCVPQTQPDAG